MRDEEAKEQLAILVAPWLPSATVDTMYVNEQCGCYSEWTTEPPRFEVTFLAPHDDEVRLSKIVSVLEPIVERWAMAHYTFRGCSCCQGEEYADEEAKPSAWVRVIRSKETVQR